jgi:hypothetical protein
MESPRKMALRLLVRFLMDENPVSGLCDCRLEMEFRYSSFQRLSCFSRARVSVELLLRLQRQNGGDFGLKVNECIGGT